METFYHRRKHTTIKAIDYGYTPEERPVTRHMFVRRI